MAPSLGDRLAEVRRERFVGRDADLALFQSAITAAELPFNLLSVFGPGGIGKTTLLDEFARLCHRAAVDVITLDARYIDPSPDGFSAALSAAMRVTMDFTEGQTPIQHLSDRSGRCVLLIDTYELLTPLDHWLRETFLPRLSEQILIVLAGRNPLAPAWRADVGWQNLIRTAPLRNLAPDESRTYLTRRAVSTDQHQAILDFTHGHPLALALVADTHVQRGDLRFPAGATPDIVRTLVEQFVEKVPGPLHRAALEACALVRLTTEGLLAALLVLPDAHEQFEWLRSLSFVDAGPRGLFPHDLAREALIAELRWRNPDWYAELHRRARTYYAGRVNQTRGQEQQRVLFDYVYLHRDSPLMRPYLDWQETGSTMPDTPHGADRADLLAMVSRYEGPESAALLDYWFDRPAARVIVYRDPESRPAGFVATITLPQATLEDFATDPAIRAAGQYLERYAPLRSGERATIFRFWMGRDTYQAVSAIQSLIFGYAAQHYLTAPSLAFSFFIVADPEFWAPMFTHVDIPRLTMAEFASGGRRYGVFAHDWRRLPPLAWLALLGERELATELDAAPPRPVTSTVVLSRPDFTAAVRAALRDFTRPEALRANPLVRSRLVIEHATDVGDLSERVRVLQWLLREAATALQSTPRDEKLYLALLHTYLQPAPTQERAAELLDLPFSTYRRHLTSGLDRVIERLWTLEIGQPFEQ